MKHILDYRYSQFYLPQETGAKHLSNLNAIERALVTPALAALGDEAAEVNYVKFFVAAPSGEKVVGVGVALFHTERLLGEFVVDAVNRLNDEKPEEDLVSWWTRDYATEVHIDVCLGRAGKLRATKAWFGVIRPPRFTYSEDPDEW